MEVLSLMNVNLRDGPDVFLLCRYKPEQKLHITLLNSNECKAFTGYATDIDLRSQAARIQMTFSDFISLSKQALIQYERGKEQFVYTLEKNCADMIFKWKSIDEEETIIDIGSVKLVENDYKSVINDVFLVLSKELLTLNNKVQTLDKEFTSVKKEKEEASQLLSEAIGMKQRVENELYSKFIVVLNEKKQKINELKRKTCNSLPSNAKLSKDSKKRSKVMHAISESSDEAIDDVECRNVPGPSTSKHNSSLPFLDVDEPESIKISPSKRRNRNRAVVNKTLNLLESKSSPKCVTMDNESEDELFKLF